MALHENKGPVEVQPRDTEKIKRIWKVAGILLVLTLIEFAFAFTMPRGWLLYTIFVGLTLVKAAYIMLEFMHLKDESKTLFWSIYLPMILLIWLIAALLKEGTEIFLMRW